ncbi:hypothetical protein MPTK1_5g07600 [Marchantia polymorpha subsp. ruderalis]|uniref:Uncharacterized protein n=2 Tax=Marchantia polymorpha TaxID=3197 RepID=A0AAF6BFZ0_MARPO|nr:hypothetical protein MARPO_0127s0025 [Marchantia polymorpha]BBN10924.1 hypothetical protein Mp_5g07600 [Marchantia polymorpha subsp. ruderalis]|eukprot:PTQ30239.1 hypothetical protein MARPO_0127s0025 [Marchantia polymorpha]
MVFTYILSSISGCRGPCFDWTSSQVKISASVKVISSHGVSAQNCIELWPHRSSDRRLHYRSPDQHYFQVLMSEMSLLRRDL